jgi:hypothetical protein
MRSRSDALAGLVVGGYLALAYLLAGPLTLIPGLLVWGWLLARHRSLPALAATCVGFGAAWILLLGQVSWTCANDPTCVLPSVTVVWLAPGVVLLAVGIVLGLVSRLRLEHS